MDLHARLLDFFLLFKPSEVHSLKILIDLRIDNQVYITSENRRYIYVYRST